MSSIALRDELVRLDKAAVWHPYTEMSSYIATAEPLVLASAAGSRLVDLDGRSLIDGNASWWTSLLGHGHPRLVRALAKQAESLAHVALAGIVHEPAARLASELVEVVPKGLTRVFFSDDGSTAIEVAAKIAVQYFFQNGQPKRHRLVSISGAFHGETLIPTSLGGVSAFRKPFEHLVIDVLVVPSAADGYETAFAALSRLLAEKGDEVAAVFLEPVLQGAGGMRTYDPAYLREAKRLVGEAGALLVADEVFTGYGRTGPMWACDHAGIAPDILCAAKGFSGGMLPMAATVVTERIFEGFFGDRSRALHYGHTFCGNPLGAAVAREVLAIYREENIVECARPKARRIAACFEELGKLDGVKETRSLGMMGALAFHDEGDYLADVGWRVYDAALRRGAYIRPLGNVVYITPALNIPDADLDALLDIVSSSVREVLSGRPRT
ncbi:MAG: adenosylmethionine--8-amino-7-oxononanoate transaminase [Polyangiaceae bacterium]